MQYFVVETMPFGENCYILYDEKSKECIVIDPGGSIEKIVAFVSSKNLSVKYVVLTHSHVDHIAGVQDVLDKYPNSKLVCSIDEKKLLKNPSFNLTRKYNIDMAFDADIYVNDTQEFEIGENKIKFFITSGHTKGSMCILADGFLFTGDTLFAGSIGRTDLPTGSFDEIVHSLEKILKMDKDLVVLPGHGPSSTIEFERRTNPFVKYVNIN